MEEWTMLAFVAAVKEMRRLQRDYTKSGNSAILMHADEAEKLVDRLIERIEQPELFPNRGDD